MCVRTQLRGAISLYPTNKAANVEVESLNGKAVAEADISATYQEYKKPLQAEHEFVRIAPTRSMGRQNDPGFDRNVADLPLTASYRRNTLHAIACSLSSGEPGILRYIRFFARLRIGGFPPGACDAVEMLSFVFNHRGRLGCVGEG